MRCGRRRPMGCGGCLVAAVGGKLAATGLAKATGMNFWSAAEADLHPARCHEDGVKDARALDNAFPDLNCDRVENGRWQRLRDDLHQLVNAGRANSSWISLLQWRVQMSVLEREHKFGNWLLPLLGGSWVYGEGVLAAAANSSITFACPLGMAAILAMSLVVVIAQVHADLVHGFTERCLAILHGRYMRAAQALEATLARAWGKAMLMLPLFAASRWPTLDVLALAEKHLLGRIHKAMAQHFGSQAADNDCSEAQVPLGVEVVAVARRLATLSPASTGEALQHPHSGRDGDSATLVGLAMGINATVMRAAEANLRRRCRPLFALYALVVGLACVEQQFVALRTGDPEHCLRFVDSLVGDGLCCFPSVWALDAVSAVGHASA